MEPQSLSIEKFKIKTLDENNSSEIIIIGAGLSGLTTAYYLSKQNIPFKILEARSRVGGRIETLQSVSGCPIELGATWLGHKHKHLIALLDELNVEVFNQEFSDKAIFEPISTSPHYIASPPSNSDPSLRIVGGTSHLINTLIQKVGEENIFTNEAVTEIYLAADALVVKTNKNSYRTKKLISTLPPNLLVNKIDFKNELPQALNETANRTHTWMAESIKVGLSFENPFWKDSDKSATILSNVGPVPEMYQHNNYEDSKYALVGFLNGSFYALTKAERKQMVLTQLRKYYGSVVDEHIEYVEKVWRLDDLTFYSYDTHVTPHQNNGHQIFSRSYLDNRLIIGGSETSPLFPGYMEGAVYRAKQIAQLLTV